MFQCPKCKKELEDGVKFCDNCGSQIVETIFCQNCGQQTSTEFAFCQNCGASLSDDAIVAPQQKKKFLLPKLPFKISKKLIAISSSCVAIVLVVAILLSIIFTGGNKNNFALYIKDGEMFYTGISKIEPWQVTTRLIDGEIDGEEVGNEELAEMGYNLGMYTQLSSDGKILFYVDKLNEDSGASLYFRYVNKPDEEPIKIDSEVTTYSISEDGKCITYLKGYDESILYQHNLKDKEKIDSEVEAFEVSGDGKKLGYLDEEGNIYLKYQGKEKEKIDSEVSRISYINKDFNAVYYIKEDSLYKKVEGKDKVKISSEVDSVIKVYESGEIYYLKSDSAEVTLLDYVEDDMKDTDAAMTEPQYPESPSYWDYDTFDEYEAAYDRYEEQYEAYQDAREAYYDKEERDELREELADETMEQSTYTLCYYNGKEEKVLTDAFASGEYSSNYTVAAENATLIFSMYNQSTVNKVKLSEIEYVSDVEEMVEAALFSSSEKYIAIKDSTTVIEQTAASNFDISSDGKTVYFIDDVSEESNHGDLYKMNVSGGKAQKPEMYDSEVYTSSAYLLSDNKFVYYKDVKDGKGELYINKEKIDYDVELYEFTMLDDETVVYMVDWNDEKDYGTLKIYDNGKIEKIADDVSTFNITPNGEILYLYDYSQTYFKGELFIYKNGKPQKIDDDVTAIIPIYDLKYRGDSYYGW